MLIGTERCNTDKYELRAMAIRNIARYRELHECCPQCNSNTIETTCVGYTMINPVEFQDGNKATCCCGWRGTVHDMVQKNNSSRG